ncbi:MAG: hypothetical protein JNJ54_09920 [Myxococcaceae bacterium]|nr:hypothetical protein [Myxococcaceae bacterium]
MIRTTATLVTVFAALSACSHAERRVEAPLPAEGKPMALVGVSAVLGMRSAQLEVTFEADMTDVEVVVWGVDELRVTSPTTPALLGSARAGEKRTFAVDYVPGAGTSTLAVSVTGSRAGLRRSRSVTFDLTPPRLAVPSVVTPQTMDGQRVKVTRLP